MGWRDRDYARWTSDERRRFLGTGSSTGRGGVRATQGAAAAAAVSAAVFALGHFPSGHPVIPGIDFGGSGVKPGSAPAIIGPSRPTVHLVGPTQVPVHSLLTFHGPVPPGDEGPVRVLASLNGGRWTTLAVADGHSGSYLARIALNDPGVLRVRILFEDGTEATQTVRVG